MMQKKSNGKEAALKLTIIYAVSFPVLHSFPEIRPLLIPVSLLIFGAIIYLNQSAENIL